jgi:transmembrane 9 superfamily protein 2/4
VALCDVVGPSCAHVRPLASLALYRILDNLPAAVRKYDLNDPKDVHYERGFPLGITGQDGQRFILNHIYFEVKYHKDSDYKGARIVGFEVYPFSVKHTYEGEWNDANPPVLNTCNENNRITRDKDIELQPIHVAGEVIYTYDVSWKESPVRWAERWNVYLEGTSDDEIHWFSIVNSLMIVLFLTGMIGMIVLRALYRDIAKYNEENVEDATEESGWKLVHGDVFRPPKGFFGPMFLSVFVGSGVQLFMMMMAVMVFAVLGFLSPANRGGLLTAVLLLFVFMGSFGGYYAARLYKMFHGKAWKRNTVLTGVMFPGTIALIAFIVNFFVWGQGSSAAIPFGTMFAVLVLWFGVSLPLVFLGAYFGFKKEEVKHPVRVNQIPRQIPPQPWYLNPFPSVMVGGVLPFGAVFIELFFIMSNLWLAQVSIVWLRVSCVVCRVSCVVCRVSCVVCRVSCLARLECLGA